MDDIARELGVSKNTVSRALRGLSGVSEATGSKILAYATDNGYQFKRNDGAMLQIAMVYKKSLTNDVIFWPSVLSGIVEYATNRGVSLCTFTVEQKTDNDLLASIKKHAIDGVMVINDIDPDLLAGLAAWSKPIVVVDSYSDGIDCDFVNTDNSNGIYKGISFLAQNNHKRIGYVGVKHSAVSYQSRYEAYLHYMNRFGLTRNEDYIWMEADWSDREYFQSKIVMLANRELAPTAWICVNDTIAMTFSQALTENGIRIPEDMSIVGFDNSILPQAPPFTTLDVQKKELGQRALEQLINRIQNPKRPYTSVFINTTLIVRDSVRRLP